MSLDDVDWNRHDVRNLRVGQELQLQLAGRAWGEREVPCLADRDRRFIFSYHMEMNGTPILVSLATVQFRPEGSGTRLLFTEQRICLDGFDDPEGRGREHGTRMHLERLERYLEKERIVR